MADGNATRIRLLEAAIELLSSAGVQAVTHRRVEEAAGVARGSARYHFGTREELLAAVLEYMASVDNAALLRAVERVPAATLEPGEMDQQTQARAMASLVADMLSRPEDHLARFELFLHAARRPELQQVVARWRQGFVDVATAHLAAQGATHPAAASRLVIAALDGIVLHALTDPSPDYLRFASAWMAQLTETAAEWDGPASDEP